MQYDFTTQPNRDGFGSSKWLYMKELKPDVSKGIIPFSVADMELKNPPEIIDGLKEYLDEAILGYTSPEQPFFDAVIAWMKRRHNWEVKKEWLLQWPGIVPAVYDLIKALSEPGDGVILMTPAYYPFFGAIEKSGRRRVDSELLLNGTRYEMDFGDLEKKARQKENTLLILCNPHNPVGRSWTRDELETLGRIAIENDVFVISDEIHFDLVLPGHKHTVFSNISEEFAAHSVTCTAPSKTFNLAGLQASNIIIQNESIRKKLVDYRETTGMHTLNTFAYRASEIAYTKCERWLEQLLALIETNRRCFVDFMAEFFPEVVPIPLEATYLQWADFRGLGLDYKELEAFMINEAELFLDEGYVFGDMGKGFERFNLACPTATLETALERLKKAWQKRRS